MPSDSADSPKGREPNALHRFASSFRAVAAGSGAARVLSASVALFEAGGKRVLSEGTKKALRTVAERGASRAIASASEAFFEPVATLGARPLAALSARTGSALSAGAPVLARQAARIAAKEIAFGTARAAGVGFAIDGVAAGVEAVIAVRGGACGASEAARHVAREATTGALATGAGVLLGAGFVALTGGAAAPVVFAVGALGAISTKSLLRRASGRSLPWAARRSAVT